MNVPFLALNRWYDGLEKTNPSLRFLIFLAIMMSPGLLIPFAPEYFNYAQATMLITLCILRVPYAIKYLV